MEKNFRKRSGILSLSIFIIILLIGLVNSIGIGFSKDVEISPKESIERSLSLQNLPEGNGDLIFTGIIEEGKEVVSFIGESEFEVPDGGVVNAPIRIKAPDNAAVGQIYKVKILFKTSPILGAESGDTVQFNAGAGISFDVIVAGKPEEQKKGFGTNIWLWILIILIVIVIIAIITKRNKK